MSRKKKIVIGDLTETVNKLLDEYGDDIYDVLENSVDVISKEARNDLRGVNRFSPNGHPTGEYSKSWEIKTEHARRLSTERIIYNEEHYSLTHLLENGHALKRGGRKYGSVKAYPHIAPVNDAAQDKLIRKVEEGIGRA